MYQGKNKSMWKLIKTFQPTVSLENYGVVCSLYNMTTPFFSFYEVYWRDATNFDTFANV